MSQSTPLKNHEKDRVPVYDRTGKIITTVHKASQSIGAAKAAKASACEWTFRFGIPGWVVKK